MALCGFAYTGFLIGALAFPVQLPLAGPFETRASVYPTYFVSTTQRDTALRVTVRNYGEAPIYLLLTARFNRKASVPGVRNCGLTTKTPLVLLLPFQPQFIQFACANMGPETIGSTYIISVSQMPVRYVPPASPLSQRKMYLLSYTTLVQLTGANTGPTLHTAQAVEPPQSTKSSN